MVPNFYSDANLGMDTCCSLVHWQCGGEHINTLPLHTMYLETVLYSASGATTSPRMVETI